MAITLPTEGAKLTANLLFKNADADRGTGLLLGLFTNSTISASTVFADLVEPTGGGYARKTLTDGSWTVTNGVATYALQTFLASSTDMTPNITGYFICTNGTTKRIINIYLEPIPLVMLVNDTYDITPTITISGA